MGRKRIRSRDSLEHCEMNERARPAVSGRDISILICRGTSCVWIIGDRVLGKFVSFEATQIKDFS